MIRQLDALRWHILARAMFAIRRRKWPANLVVLGPLGIGGRGALHIGHDVRIVSLSRYNRAGINHPTQLAIEPSGTLQIGDRVGLSGAAIYCENEIRIGNDVLMGANCRVYDTDFHPVAAEDRLLGRPPLTGAIQICDNVWLGANVTVLKGVTIGARTVVAAGSIVTSNLPEDCVAAGNPARVVRSLPFKNNAKVKEK
jgi:carbonic anhydrase/acetyltransferase-like protein (isoleucine patch superfamily)